MITQKELRRILHYDAKRGVWKWRIPGCGRRAVVGNIQSHGYRLIGIDGKLYLSSRLAWLYIRGYFPENEVDHINRIRDDDRWKNLREVSRQCNRRNCGNHKDNTSGVKGVSWYKRTQEWRVRICVHGKYKFLGHFTDFTEAVAHRMAAEQCLDWAGCDSNSPAFQYMKNYLNGGITNG